MSEIIITKSPDINQTDEIKYQGKQISFNLDDKNNTDNSLILIYMYLLPKFQTHGIKIGMTKCKIGETFWHAIKSRIHDQQHELALTDDQYQKYGLNREVIYWGICLDAKNDSFKDYEVHNEIKKINAGIAEQEQEWFTKIPADELIINFNSLRHKDENKKIYTPRKEQQECIDAMSNYFNKNPKGRFLLNCKMRFGKSFTTYKYCEDHNLERILILTFIPAVESSWREDLSHIKKNYRYFTDDNLRRSGFELNFEQEPYVLFLSLQNYLGKEKNSDVKVKIKQLQDIDWDLVILDEYHFGAWNQKTQGTLKVKEEKSEDLESEYQDKLKQGKDIIKHFNIRTKQTICLSGTPFKAIARGEFTDNSSFTYSYFDEQRNKYPKSEENDFTVINPDYEAFPDMKIFGYNMSRLFGNLTASVFSEDKLLTKKYFSLNKFFETRQENNPNEPCTFIYEEEIKKWLEIIKGRSIFGDKFPYSNPQIINNNIHTLWLMPTVKSCKAMENLLNEDDYFSRYKIINLSQDEVGSGNDAYEYLMNNITASENTNKLGSIAITVNKLTIGVTVKKWSSVFVLKDLASPEQYFQAIFRIQTPYVENNKIKKKEGYVYDFNIDRASALLLKYAEQSANEQTTKMQIAKLIVKYMPIFINGDMSNPISYKVFYELAQFGDSNGIPLSKKITDTSKTTRMLDEETVAAMLNDKEVSDIIKRVFAHAKFGKTKTKTVPSKPEDGFDSTIAKEGRNKGYELGQQDYKKYVDYDDLQVQAEFEKALSSYINEYCPKDYDQIKATWYANGFKKGYESGVNAPIKKEQCGYDDGVKFVDEVKKKFGQDIKYTTATKISIDNFVKNFLNDINNIPNKYRGMLYKRWYCDSFRRAIKNNLNPIKEIKNGETIEDADNVLKHILARLFEFLYISVYRETTFMEIFNNADPNVFLEAVGITKKDFEVLNKYKVFQEDVLNNYIHDFFINESLGLKIDSQSKEAISQYRNSFDWFEFGLENNEQIDNNENIVNSNITTDNGNSKDEEKIIDNKALFKENEISFEDKTVSKTNQLEEKIKNLLMKHKALKINKISNLLNVSKDEINKVLNSNKNLFYKDLFFNWKLK
ncbi:MAG TPA: hypothetical protein DHU62_06005 [Firmicutes bacterium]|nr:hypothetical protein [Bacillota bacterium]